MAEVRLYRGVLALSVKASSQVAELGAVTTTTTVATKALATRAEHLGSTS